MSNKYKAETQKYSIRLETAKIKLLKHIYGEESFTKFIERLIDEKIEGVMQQPKKINSPIIRIGGKSLIAQRIVELMPPHKVYCDLFGGAGHILLGKDPNISKMEIFNDKYGDIINLFQVIKDRPLDLRAKILEIPCSRAIYNKMKSLPVPEDKVERAAWYFYLIRNSFFGDMRSGWRATSKNNVPKTIQHIADELYWVRAYPTIYH